MHCTACGYDLTAHSSGERCPECGVGVDESLWAEFDRKDESSPERFGTLIIGGFWMFCAGAIVTISLIALWSGGGALWVIGLIAAVPAAIAGAFSGLVWKRYARMWASVFAWPMVGWGFAGAWLVPSGGIGFIIWPAIAVVTLGATIGGVAAGRWLARTPVPQQSAT